MIDFIKDFLIYEEIAVNGKNYLLVHAGLGNYLPDKDIEDYSIHEIIWTRADYDVQYFKDTYVVTGHTPTQTIKDNLQLGYIYRRNNNIAIDCGASTISTFLSQWQMDFLNQISRTSSMETINREAVQMTLSNITRKIITKPLFQRKSGIRHRRFLKADTGQTRMYLK